METLVKRLEDIKSQIVQLKAEQLAIQKTQQQKDKEITRLRQLIDIQNSSIRQLESKLKIKRIADEFSNGEAQSETGSKRDLKFKINEMINEIDKVITLIHR